MTPAFLSDPRVSRPSSIAETTRVPITPEVIQQFFSIQLGRRGWREERIVPKNKGGLKLLIPCLKDGISARFMSQDRIPAPTFANWLLMDVPRAQGFHLSEVSVLVVAAPDVEMIIQSGTPVQELFTTDHAEAQLQDLLPVPHLSPFAIIQASLIPAQMTVEHLTADPRLLTTGEGLVKSLEFPPEYYQAGVSILSYFGEVLRQKHPEVGAKVRIEQDGYTVRLHIVSSKGDIETIEATLQQYAMVVSGQAPPEQLLSERWQVLALENKLEVVLMELRQSDRLRRFEKQSHSKQLKAAQQDNERLRQLIGEQIKLSRDAHQLLDAQQQSTERLLLAQITQSGAIIQELIREAGANTQLKRSLELIEAKLQSGIGPADETQVTAALMAIQHASPGMYERLRAGLVNTMYGVSGNYVFAWIQAIEKLL